MSAQKPLTLPGGAIFYPQGLSLEEQTALLAALIPILTAAPPFQPIMPKSGKGFSVKMTNAGTLGWVSDQKDGYRYQAQHPLTHRPWPAIPPLLLALWRRFTGVAYPPEACLINLYSSTARMGLHQDRDEEDLSAPVLSFSLGDTARFRLGGQARADKTLSFRLESGAVLILTGAARLAFHGVDRILPGTSGLLEKSGFYAHRPALSWVRRINLTLRRVRLSDPRE